MIRAFCDICEDEITEKNKFDDKYFPLSAGVVSKGTGKETFFNVVTAGDDSFNKGDFCKYCVLDALRGLDDRPRTVRNYATV